MHRLFRMLCKTPHLFPTFSACSLIVTTVRLMEQVEYRLLLGWELEMFSEQVILLYFLSNDVDNPLTQSKVGAQKHQKLFAIVWINPHTILYLNETIRPEN